MAIDDSEEHAAIVCCIYFQAKAESVGANFYPQDGDDNVPTKRRISEFKPWLWKTAGTEVETTEFEKKNRVLGSPESARCMQF